jgi:hypothetical protein
MAHSFSVASAVKETAISKGSVTRFAFSAELWRWI